MHWGRGDRTSRLPQTGAVKWYRSHCAWGLLHVVTHQSLMQIIKTKATKKKHNNWKTFAFRIFFYQTNKKEKLVCVKHYCLCNPSVIPTPGHIGKKEKFFLQVFSFYTWSKNIFKLWRSRKPWIQNGRKRQNLWQSYALLSFSHVSLVLKSL